MIRNLVLIVSAFSVVACSSGKSAAPGPTTAAPTSPTPTTTTPSTPTGPPTISITANGMVPLEITINVGQRVTFVNNDTRTHDVTGGVDPAHPDCPEILQAGFMVPGQRNDTGVFTTARTCEYHDHTMLGVPGFQGRIFIR